MSFGVFKKYFISHRDTVLKRTNQLLHRILRTMRWKVTHCAMYFRNWQNEQYDFHFGTDSNKFHFCLRKCLPIYFVRFLHKRKP